jgi:hypothetical protein
VSWRLDNAHKIYAPDEFHILGGSTILEVVSVADLRIQSTAIRLGSRSRIRRHGSSSSVAATEDTELNVPLDFEHGWWSCVLVGPLLRSTRQLSRG